MVLMEAQDQAQAVQREGFDPLDVFRKGFGLERPKGVEERGHIQTP